MSCFDLNIELYSFCRKFLKPKASAINADSWSMDFRGNVWYQQDQVLSFMKQCEGCIDSYVEKLLNSPERIIGFSVQSTSKFFSLEVARKIKAKDKDRLIVFGGPLCFKNCYGIDILKDFTFLDFVCFQEAERCLPQLLNNIEKHEGVLSHPGFGYRRKDGTIIDGGDAQPIEDLDEIPFADYSKFDLAQYTKKSLPISTSRGCINRCTFCSESTHWRRYRTRSAQNIFSEIKYQLKRYPDIDRFWFNDSLINGDLKILDELCDLLISEQIKIKWGGQGMIRREMTKVFLQKMKQAGCQVISYGVENGNSNILKQMRKAYTPELAEVTLRDTFQAGINVIFNIIVGFPTETDSEFEQTKDFLKRCHGYASHIELVSLLLLKGSYLYNHLEEFNIAPINYQDPDWQLNWQTKDRQNTYDIRKRRLEELTLIR
ncbi:B12-binding domain-containing radical SAM protein [Candidatus Omnitrophota bacterium]